MAQRKTLNEKQVAVLRWIAHGCWDGRMVGDSYRITAAALRSRGLVTTSGRGPKWTAKVTTDGVKYLAKVDGPNPPLPRQPDVSVTEQLVTAVIEAGGSLTVPRLDYYHPGRVDWESRARLAERHGKVPAGKRVKVRSMTAGEIRIDLVDDPANLPEPDQAVLVPVAVSRYHPVVREFRERPERHEVSRVALPRVRRILQGLVVEAEHRGHSVRLSSGPKNDGSSYGRRARWTGPNDGHLVISARDYPVVVRLSEEGLPSRAHWERQNGRFSYSPGGAGKWVFPPLNEYEAKATGRLILEFVPTYGHSGRPHRWADRKSWKLEDKLADVLRGIELRAVDHEERQRDAAREAAQRKRAWEASVERARERHGYQRQADTLAAQISQWRESQRIRAYCDAAESGHRDDPDTAQWIRWARAHADSIDPLRTLPRGPAPAKPASLDELQPFL